MAAPLAAMPRYFQRELKAGLLCIPSKYGTVAQRLEAKSPLNQFIHSTSSF